MAKRNTSNNPLFREIRELEEKALKAGIIEKGDTEAMREEAWECYLIGRLEWLKKSIREHELDTGAES